MVTTDVAVGEQLRNTDRIEEWGPVPMWRERSRSHTARVTNQSSSSIAVSLRRPNGQLVDLELHIDDEAMTIGELAPLIRLHACGEESGDGGGSLIVDGRRLPSSASLYEAKLWDGAVISYRDDAPAGGTNCDSNNGAVVAIEQMAGLAGGETVGLTPGHYRFGSTLAPDDLAQDGVAFELDVDSEGRCVVHPPSGDIGDDTSALTIDGRPLTAPHPLTTEILSIGPSRFALTAVPPSSRRTPKSRALHRTPRRIEKIPQNSIDAPVPPKTPGDPPKLSWIMMLAPIPAAAVMAYFFNPRFAMFAAMGPIMVLARWFEGRRSVKKQRAIHAAELTERSAELAAQVHHLRNETTSVLRRNNPSTDELLRRARLQDARLWERRPTHDDFACISVAVGDVDWRAGEDDTQRLDPVWRPVVDRFLGLPSIPVVADLRSGPLGIVGTRQQTLCCARAVLVSAATLSGPLDLPLTLVADPEDLDDWDWLKWMPHLARPARVPSSGDELDAIVEKQRREPSKNGLGKDQPAEPLPIFLLDGVNALQRHGSTLRRALAEDAGVTAIILAQDPDDLPASCTTVLEIDESGTARFSDLANHSVLHGVTPVGATTAVAADAARALAWMTDPDGLGLDADLPSRVLLPEIMNGIGSHATHARWIAGGIDPNPLALIGTGPTGTMAVDIVRDGPHGLLAGTTGAGKSEFLRSFVASVAATTSPDHVNFVLIDYKGGGAFDVCAELPHTVAVVTDLDEHLGERALRSLQAELKYREKLFRAAEVHDVGAYRATGRTLPRLLVIVDEFATLAAELPDFLGALVDIAQRGRSLGIHMILATQRPAGVLDNKIRANTNLRISLRVQDENDSMDVIGIDAAAKLARDDVGRGFIRLGAAEVTAFQAAYVGGHSRSDDQLSATTTPFLLVPPPVEVDRWSTPALPDLERMVANITDAFVAGGYEAPRKPWLPALPSHLPADRLPAHPSSGTSVAFAMADVPEDQDQRPLFLDLHEGNVAVYGMHRATTANTLASIALGFAATHSPNDLHLHVIDQGKRLLSPLGDLPHCGTYVSIDDLDMITRLIDLLEADLRDRRTKDRPDATFTVVIAEGLGALFETLTDSGKLDLATRLGQILRDGPNLGLVVIGSSSHDRGLPTRVASQIAVKLLHELVDVAAYASFGLRPKEVPALRGNDVFDLRTNHHGVVASFGDLAAAVEAIEPPDRIEHPPATIRVLGDRVDAADLALTPTRVGDRFITPLGLSVASVTDVAIEIEDRCLIVGPSGSGRTTTLSFLAEQMRRAEPTLRIVGIARSGSPLRDHVDTFFAANADEAPGHVIDPSTPTVVLIDDAERLSPAVAKEAEEIAKAAGRNLWVIAATRPDAAKDLSSWLKVMRGARSGVALQPSPTDGEAFRIAFPLRTPQRFPAGQAFAVSGGIATLVQVAERSIDDGRIPTTVPNRSETGLRSAR